MGGRLARLLERVVAGPRAPGCPRCEAPTVLVADEPVLRVPMVFEAVYACPRCGEVVRRRRVYEVFD